MLQCTIVHVPCRLFDGTLWEMRDQCKVLTLQSPREVINLGRRGDTCNLLPFILLVISLLLTRTLCQIMTKLSAVETLNFTQVLLLFSFHSPCKNCVIIKSLFRMKILVSQFFLNEVIPQPVPVSQLVPGNDPLDEGLPLWSNPCHLRIWNSLTDGSKLISNLRQRRQIRSHPFTLYHLYGLQIIL